MKVIACVASGPSLTRNDCLSVVNSGIEVIAVNSSWKMIPECRNLYAGDFQWWQENHRNIPEGIVKWSGSHSAASKYGTKYFQSPVNGSFNSGQRAILLAHSLGAERIILLGYDCSVKNGIHWHKDHEMGLKNPDGKSVFRWKREFSEIKNHVPLGIIFNCSRYSELDMFNRADLEEQLSVCKNTT